MYRLDLENLIVLWTDRHGQEHDVNEGGDPFEDIDTCREFCFQLRDEDMISALDLNALVRPLVGLA